MQALHFGAGNIGRGFIGRVLSNSGFNLIFSDINQNIINSINHYKKYKIKLISDNFKKNIYIKNITAVHFSDPKISNIISNVDLITTAVGPNALDKVAMSLLEGIILKIRCNSIKPLNIIACENKIRASSYLKKSILNKIPIKYHNYIDTYIGFVDCSIDTIIPTCSSSEEKNNLSLIAEKFQEWIVDKNQFKGKIPEIIDMKVSDNLISFIDRKFLTLNTGHAIAAYLGSIKNYTNIYETISNSTIENIVKNAMNESGIVLIKRYKFNKKDHISYINKIFNRFKNPIFSDRIERIGRNPIQKLSQDERLIRPFLGAIQYNFPYFNLVRGIAAALHYKNKNDIESIKLSSLIKNIGIEKTLVKVTNLDMKRKEINIIIKEYNSILKSF
ncbi:mannitol-1-phosphate 5-dehydrogenase [Buchnera aphidicola]|uniref:mannitol-1-phosphate 5-dehydrogenase n=1 Tax=Buchnera aphidicola TaxID=9 RepID=UPI003463F8BF